MKMCPQQSRGFAAISAILVAATVAAVGTLLAWEGALAIRQAENITAARQAGLLVHTAATSATVALSQDDPRVDHRGESWARGVPPIEIEGAKVDGVITDEQGKFNVNNLADRNGASEVDVAAFRRLLERVGLPASLADAAVDWIDDDNDVTQPLGAEDAYYVGRNPPYRTANRRIADISELLLVKGFTADRFRRLAPYLTALPGSTRVNVNSASAELLAAILPGVSESVAKKLVADRDKEPYGSRMEFSSRLPDAAAKAASDLLDVRSDYFVVRGTARAGRISAGYRALVGREGPKVISITRDFG
jgi:general secretion pathway protein K